MLTETHLTEDHVDRLLELCKRFFPEYDPKMMYQLPAHKDERIRFGKIWFYKDDFEFECAIHWYELCLTYLFDRMFDPEDLNLHYQHWSMFTKALQQETHPVDYLYTKFKRIYNVEPNAELHSDTRRRTTSI